MNIRGTTDSPSTRQALEIPAGSIGLPADLEVPETARGIVVFAHGSGSSRQSPRNRAVAAALRSSGRFGTLLFDLLTPEEDARYANRFDVDLLTDRLVTATAWLGEHPEARDLPVGYFGASTGAAAALGAAASESSRVRAIVSRGGRPDLAKPVLPSVRVPTLLIVGGLDSTVIGMNEIALSRLGAKIKKLEIVPGATHLFEERGAIETVVRLTSDWFERYLA